MNTTSQSTGLIDAVTSFMQKFSHLTEWFLVVLGVILFCYAFARGTAERKAADHGIHGN
jgi:Na+/melibiose symporter-like transporter